MPIRIPYNGMMKCVICGHVETDLKQFSFHVSSAHNLKSEAYTIIHLHGNVRPTCKTCGAETRYVAFTFKSFCKQHAKLAMSAGGKFGGVNHVAWNKGKTKVTDARVKAQADKQSGSNNPFFGRKHSSEILRRISLSKTLSGKSLTERITAREDEFVLVTPLDEYTSRQNQYLDFVCVKCNNTCYKTLQAFERGSLCPTCYPNNVSQWELTVDEFIKSLGVEFEMNDRSVISPKELDIYIPNKQFAIECNGLYHHSEFNGKDKAYHVNKHVECLNSGVKLYHMFEDEWKTKNEICKSMIRHRLGISLRKVEARKCKLEQVSKKSEVDFFNANHISGFVGSKANFALTKDGETVAMLSLRIPRHQKKYPNTIEIARFVTSLNTCVVGGLGKLMKVAKQWSLANGFSKIMTYADARFGTGMGYKSIGMKLLRRTDPDYWYTDNYVRYNRFKYSAKNGRTENEIASEARVARIWGCGSYVYELVL